MFKYMPIICQICNQQFKSLITSTHLKKHNLHSRDYINLYGKDSLASAEYRLQKSIKCSGENNPNFGNIHSEETKTRISQKKLDIPSWNKGVKFTDTTIQKIAAQTREQRYISGELIRKPTLMTDVIKKKISGSVKEYAENNKDVLKLRANAAVKTKIANGYYIEKRKRTESNFIEKCNNFNFSVYNILNSIATLKCNTCSSTHMRSVDSKVHKNMCPLCSAIGTSSYELELYNELKSFLDTEIVVSDKSILGNLELDVYLPQYKLAIEIDGLYWHSEAGGKGKYYHKYKTDKCNEVGIQLIHIFEDEWLYKREICLNRIKHKLQISEIRSYARNYKIKEISAIQSYDFLSKTHIQGRGSSTNLCYALVDKYDTICAVMTFSKLNISKGMKHQDGVYELSRYSSIGSIIGGASKLFKYFLKSINPRQVISYSDLRWNTGNLYKKLGFNFVGNTQPGYWYIKGIERIHRFKLRKTEVDPKHLTEKQIRETEGYTRIWDCGHSKWVWGKMINN
jgi:very-short-patch-repair endonuclease